MGSNASLPPRRNCRFAGRTSRGFTLIELTMVLLIVGILAAAAAPKYATSVTSFRLQAVSHRIAGDLRYAKRLAQQYSSPQTIVFDIATNSYSMTGVTDINRRTRTYQFSLSDTEYQCVLVSASFNSAATLTFDVYGRPNYSGTIVVSCGGTSKTLTVDSLGQVTL